MKNIWKNLLAMATLVTMMATFVACPATDTEPVVDVYISGFLGSHWAADTKADKADKMTRDGDVYTFSFTADGSSDTVAKAFPYGFKFSTSKGWNEQFVNGGYKTATKKERLSNNVKVTSITATKAEVEKKGTDGKALYNDDYTKFWFAADLEAKEKYTITFDKAAMTVKIAGKSGTLIRDDVMMISAGFTVQGPLKNADAWIVEDMTVVTAGSVYAYEFKAIAVNQEFGCGNKGWSYKMTGADTLTVGGAALPLTFMPVDDTPGAKNNKVTGLTVDTTYVITLTITDEAKATSTVKVTAK